MSDEQWIILVNKLGPKLYRFFLSQQNKVQAEESVQEVFTRLFDKFNGDFLEKRSGNIEAFAWGIALNLRKEIWRQRRFTEDLAENEHLDQLLNSVTIEGPISLDLAAMIKVISTLDEPEKTIIQFVLADMQISDISMALQLPTGTVKSHIYRAKENIRSKMRKWGIL